jgi:predicted kinase
MSEPRIILVTGLPASGKTTFARTIGERFRVPVLCKDAIKEPLLDVLGADDAAASRSLSDASFAALFAMARELYAARVSMVLEGNFRPGEHEPALREAVSPGTIAQVLCTVDEAERLARLTKRDADPSRHPGHRDREQATAFPNANGNTFLDVPGERFVTNGQNAHEVLAALERWWTSRTL